MDFVAAVVVMAVVSGCWLIMCLGWPVKTSGGVSVIVLCVPWACTSVVTTVGTMWDVVGDVCCLWLDLQCVDNWCVVVGTYDVVRV